MEFLFITTFTALLLLVWFKSEALIEWGSLLGISKFLKTEEFQKMKFEELPNSLNYPTFLKIKYNNFITKLISCPLCLSIWLSIFISTITFFITSNLIFLLLIPPTIILSLFIYGIIVIVLKI